MSDNEVYATVLQFGFAGVLVIYVWVVNKQFSALIDVLGSHLSTLSEIIRDCASVTKTPPD